VTISARARACAIALLLLVASIGTAGCALPIIGATQRPRPDPAQSDPPSRAARLRRAAAHPSTPDRCYEDLAAAGVAFERVEPARALGVEMPVRLLGPIGGVTVRARGDDRVHAVLDCRLSLALLSWAPALAAAGVVGIEHYSIYRPRARTPRDGKVSGHARGLAIDAARFHLTNGEVLDVLTDWEDRERGSAPCPRRPEEAWPSRLLRGVVCEAVESSLFQVVLTPHHDRAHDNHVHLELKPEVGWTYVR
jgi:hypothetical protein